MDREVFVLIGPAGAGKSSWANWYDQTHSATAIVSADYYFYGPRGYEFDPTKLPDAHAACLCAFVSYIQEGVKKTIIVDNTNTTIPEIAPYVALARAYGYSVRCFVWAPLTGKSKTRIAQELAQQTTHGVSVDTIIQQLVNIAKLAYEWPFFWPKPTKQGIECRSLDF